MMSEMEYETNSEEDTKEVHLTSAFNQLRHCQPFDNSQPIEKQSWRMKERMKTVSVALVMCLNVGVDPPDIIKPHPCSVMESWIDPFSLPPQKALEAIGANLLKQYERWQPRARYKQSLDPTVEDVKKLCTSLRRNAKDERVLFHYNGHGVPKPTINGEIWVFNRNYTQYIPLSIYDLQQWMGAPSIYVYDCSAAGLIVDSFKQFAVQHEREYEMNMNANNGSPFALSAQSPPLYKNCIQLASCADNQLLPMNPDLPADLFTSCLTTPIKIALRWFIRQSAGKLVPGITMELLDKIPGQLSDRRTMLGELNWIFTAITDTIAWNVLSRDLFQRLFRQDLLVASLFRNFLLAERIMRTYDCTPISSPSLPPTYYHPMWQAWDLAVDICLSQLPAILNDDAQYKHSPFFAEQLTAFQVWLTFGSRPDSHPEQLPIVLQVLLSQVHRLRALDLLSRFLDLGPWAVNLALSVGIFPYVLKLLQSSARELRPLLVFIWAKVLAVDGSCQADLVRDNGHRYFLNVLADPYMPSEHRTMAAFVMACIVKNYSFGQEVTLQGNASNGNLIDLCLEQLNDSNPLLRQWLVICLGHIWENYDNARWIATRNTAHEKLFVLLDDSVPEVRAAAVYALGTFVNSAQERTDHANALDHNIAFTLINKVLHDSSLLVRKELLVALHWFVLIFENNFLAIHKMEDEKIKEIAQISQISSNMDTSLTVGTPPLGLRKVASRDRLSTITINKLLSVPISITSNTHQSIVNEALTPPNTYYAQNIPMKRVNSSNSLSNFPTNSASMISSVSSIANVYWTIWKAITTLCNDPHPEVALMAQVIIDDIKSRVAQSSTYDCLKESNSDPSFSEPASPNANASYMSESPTSNIVTSSSRNTTPIRENMTAVNRSIMISPYPHAQHQHQFSTFVTPYSRKRTIFGREPSVSAKSEEGNIEDLNNQRNALISTSFVNWCTKHFSRICYPEELDAESPSHHEKEWRSLRFRTIEEIAKKELLSVDVSHIDEQLLHQKNQNIPQHLAFHPYENRLIVAEKDTFSIWNTEMHHQSNNYYNHNINATLLGTYSNLNQHNSRITSMQLINTHEITLLMFGCDDGSVRVWKNCGINDLHVQPELVTAFHIFSDITPIPKSSGVILSWNQLEQKLIATGEPRVIRLWDARKEMKIRDLTTGADTCVTTISSDGNHLICVGCGDGSVRVFDDRLMPHDSRVLTFYEHKSWIINAHIYPENEKHVHIISGSLTGDIKWYDKRLSSSIKSVNTGLGMTAMSVHPEADVFACGLGNQSLSNGYQAINIYTLDAIPGSSVRHSDGFMSQRVGPICSLAFHPMKALLAAGCSDNFISLYGPSKYY